MERRAASLRQLRCLTSVLWMVKQAEREKMQTEEQATRSSAEMSADWAEARFEDENVELRQLVQTLQAQLSQVEKDHAHRSHSMLFAIFRHLPSLVI